MIAVTRSKPRGEARPKPIRPTSLQVSQDFDPRFEGRYSRTRIVAFAGSGFDRHFGFWKQFNLAVMSSLRSITLAVLLLICSVVTSEAGLSIPKCFKCPYDDSMPIECLKSAIPPWPMCLFHDVDFFVRAARDGATRCCNGANAAANMSECRCPKKDTPPFQNKIADWCKDIATCPKKSEIGSADGTSSTTASE